MKYILQSSLTFSAPSRAILYDEAEKLLSEGHEVCVLFCGKSLDMCFRNMNGDKRSCEFCTLNYTFYDRISISPRIKMVSLRDFLSESILSKNQKIEFEYREIYDIKKIKHLGVNIGLACLSSYLTITRNLYPKIDNDFRLYFNNLLRNSALMCDLIAVVFEELKPDHVYGYNGRFLENRPLWEYAKQCNIPFSLLEAQYTFSFCNKIVIENDTPHSIEAYDKNYIQDLWENNDLEHEERKDLASEFYIRRRNALPAGDKIYTINQKAGLLPEHWNYSKKNIVIFTSSEDEFASIGESFEKFSLFPSQIAGIEEILKHFNESSGMEFYLRIHPNLSGIEYAYHKKIYELEKYRNLRIISPDSSVSSYSLIDMAEKVVVFGSTIGVEAVYWGKPTILLAGSLYYFLDCCYLPSSREELFELIKSDLLPKDKIGAYKYGLAFHDSIGITCDRVDCNWKTYDINFLGLRKKITINNWEKLFGSHYLFYIFKTMTLLPVKLYCSIKNLKPKYHIPVTEQYL